MELIFNKKSDKDLKDNQQIKLFLKNLVNYIDSTNR